MDTLLNPDSGLAIWTIVTFLTLVFLLKRFAWKPILHAIEEREALMRREREQAERARQEAERVRQEIDKRLAGISAETSELLAEAHKEGEAIRDQIKNAAEEESKKLLAKTRAQLEEERRRLAGELRREVAEISTLAAERLIRKSVDDGVRKGVLEQFFHDLDSRKRVES